MKKNKIIQNIIQPKAEFQNFLKRGVIYLIQEKIIQEK